MPKFIGINRQIKGSEIENDTVEATDIKDGTIVKADLSIELLTTLLIPVGTVLPYAGATCPAGFLFCDGSVVSKTVYAALSSVCLTTYNVGTELQDTFRIPDLRGIFIRGVGTQIISGITYTANLGAKQVDQFRAHAHTTNYYRSNGAGDQALPARATDTDSFSTLNTGSAGGTETNPANLAMNYIIKF